jgi:hypothetical protein
VSAVGDLDDDNLGLDLGAAGDDEGGRQRPALGAG